MRVYFIPYLNMLWNWCTDHIKDASRMLVLLASGSIGASAMMTPESTAPPKQYSIALNQHAKGLRRDTSNAPVNKQQIINNIRLKRHVN